MAAFSFVRWIVGLSFSAQTPRPPTSDNVRYVAFKSKNRLGIRTNAESLPITNVAPLGKPSRIPEQEAEPRMTQRGLCPQPNEARTGMAK